MESSQPSSNDAETKKPAFAGTIEEQALHSLREQIKNAMIPLLIKIFRLKQEAQNPANPSAAKAPASPDGVRTELLKIDEDLKQLDIWCQSCRTHIQKALKEPETLTTAVNASSHAAPNPTLQQAISEALAATAHLPSLMSLMAEETRTSPQATAPTQKRSWIRKLSDLLKS